MVDMSRGDQPTRIKVNKERPLMRMNTSDYFDLGQEVFIHVTKSVSESPIPPTDKKVISLRHVTPGTSSFLDDYLKRPDHVG